jgi:hypothetical protein
VPVPVGAVAVVLGHADVCEPPAASGWLPVGAVTGGDGGVLPGAVVVLPVVRVSAVVVGAGTGDAVDEVDGAAAVRVDVVAGLWTTFPVVRTVLVVAGFGAAVVVTVVGFAGTSAVVAVLAAGGTTAGVTAATGAVVALATGAGVAVATADSVTVPESSSSSLSSADVPAAESSSASSWWWWRWWWWWLVEADDPPSSARAADAVTAVRIPNASSSPAAKSTRATQRRTDPGDAATAPGRDALRNGASDASSPSRSPVRARPTAAPPVAPTPGGGMPPTRPWGCLTPWMGDLARCDDSESTRKGADGLRNGKFLLWVVERDHSGARRSGPAHSRPEDDARADAGSVTTPSLHRPVGMPGRWRREGRSWWRASAGQPARRPRAR